MRRRLGLAGLILSAAMIATSCTTTSSGLDDTSWLLESYGTPGDLTGVIDGTNVSLEFQAGGIVTGSTGCNVFQGTYRAKGDALTIQYQISPGPRCDLSAIVEQEQMFLAIIVLAQRYAIEGDTLTIDCGERTLVFRRR